MVVSLERTLKFFSRRRYVAALIRGFDIRMNCARPGETPLAVEEILTPPYPPNEKPEGYFSTCIFGQGEAWRKTYFLPLLESIKRWLEEFPRWRYRVYAPREFPVEHSRELVSAGAEVFRMNRGQESNSPTLWRFLPAAQELPFLSMDADLPYEEESARHLRAWLASGKKFYWKRMLGGLIWPVAAPRWGSRGAIPGWGEKLAAFADTCNCFGCDELFLKQELYPLLVKEDTYKTQSVYFEIFWGLVFFLFLLALGIFLWLVGRLGGRVE